MSGLLPWLVVVSVSMGATEPEASVSFGELDGGVELGAPAWPESSIAVNLRRNDAAPERIARQEALFALAGRSGKQIAADPKAPIIDVVTEGLRYASLTTEPRRPPTPLETQATTLISVLRRMTSEGERKFRVTNLGVWFEGGRGVDETRAALIALRATAEVAAFDTMRKAYAAYAATADDSVDEQATAEKFAKTVDAFVALEPGYRKKLDVWLRARVRSGELPTLPAPTPQQGTVIARHRNRFTDVTPRDDGLYFLTWDQELGYRRTLERIDPKGARTVVASGLEVHHGFRPWRDGWGWVDNRGGIRSLGPDGGREELSFAKFSVEGWASGGADLDFLLLAPRREWPKAPQTWLLVAWRRSQTPRVIGSGSGSAELLGARAGSAALRVGSRLFLVGELAAPSMIPIPAGQAFWLDDGVVMLTAPMTPTAQFERVELSTGAVEKLGSAASMFVSQHTGLLSLTTGSPSQQQLSVMENPRTAVPLGTWPFVMSVARTGDEFIVATVDSVSGFGTLARVRRPTP